MPTFIRLFTGVLVGTILWVAYEQRSFLVALAAVGTVYIGLTIAAWLETHA